VEIVGVVIVCRAVQYGLVTSFETIKEDIVNPVAEPSFKLIPVLPVCVYQVKIVEVGV
jgi:hypothetical protein